MQKHKVDEDSENATKLRNCLADLDSMIERAKLLCAEFKTWRELPQEQKIDPALMKNSISFAEVRDLDIRCRETLAQVNPVNPEEAQNWYINESMDLAAPEEMLTHLQQKRTKMQSIINDLGIRTIPTEPEKSADDVVILKPSFFGVGIDLKAAWKKVRKKFGKK